LKVERVQVVDLGEGEDAGEGQQEVEAQDDQIVTQQERRQMPLVGNWSH